MRAFFYSLAGIMLLTSLAYGQSTNIGSVPVWMENLPPKPEWWSSVNVVFTNDIPDSGYWVHINESKNKIDQLVDKGVSPVRERRELIKYINSFETSALVPPHQRENLELEEGELYSRLGENQRAAKIYAEAAGNDPENWVPFDALAWEYQRAGEKNYALQTYILIDQRLKDRPNYKGFGSVIVSAEIALLEEKTSGCILKKPVWWDQFKNPPDRLTNTAGALPPITSFQDGISFISANFKKQTDHQKKIQACVALLDFPAATIRDRQEALTMLALAYDAAGDHHRAIITAWECVDQFSSDRRDCVGKLKFISREFEKLGESENAQEIQNAIPCFSNEAK